MNIPELKKTIEEIQNKNLDISKYETAIETVISLLDKGELRVANIINGEWQTEQWVKQAILYYFSIKKMELIQSEKFEYYDKIPVKTGYKELGVRVVPPAT